MAGQATTTCAAGRGSTRSTAAARRTSATWVPAAVPPSTARQVPESEPSELGGLPLHEREPGVGAGLVHELQGPSEVGLAPRLQVLGPTDPPDPASGDQRAALEDRCRPPDGRD